MVDPAVSRVYGGIHFSFDNDAGQQVGADVAEYVLEHQLLPQGAPGARPVVPPSVFADSAEDEDRLAYLTDLCAD